VSLRKQSKFMEERSETALKNGWSSYPADLWNQRRPPEHVADLEFWKYCAEKYGSPILDLCCGNGRISIPLAKLGYEVIGVDINASFISSAERRVAAARQGGKDLQVSFRVGDIIHLEANLEFRLAIVPDWSFQVLLTQENQLSFLGRLHQALMPGGAFAFNLFSPFHRQKGLIAKDGRYEWPPDPAYHNSAPRTYDPLSQIETLVEWNVHPIQLRHTTLSELELLFRLTGFGIVEIYGDVDRRLFTGGPDSDYTIVAERT
jgi:SAM-dependent methyltransferase